MSGRTLMPRRHNSRLLKPDVPGFWLEPFVGDMSFRTALAVKNLLCCCQTTGSSSASLLGMTFSRENRRNHAQETYC